MKKHLQRFPWRMTGLLIVGGLAGCSILNPSGGAGDFSCPGMPQGVICKTPTAVYNSTNDAMPQSDHDVPINFYPDGSVANQGVAPAKGGAVTSPLPQDYAPPIGYAPASSPVNVGGRAVVPNTQLDEGSRDPEQFLRDMERATQKTAQAKATPYIPVRTPATVMRIWIAPWIDKNDDLHLPSHLYTEVEPRKWSIGSLPNVGAAVVVPHRDNSVTAGATNVVPTRQVVPQNQPSNVPMPSGAAAQGQAFETLNSFNAGAINLNDR